MRTQEQAITDFDESFRLAIQSERESREASYTELPEVICGVQVNQMEIRHLVMLQLLDSPFICGGIPDQSDVAQFMWIVSPLFEFCEPAKRDRFTHGLRRLPFANAVQSIHDYVSEAFADAPSGKSGESISYAAWPSALVDLIASEYGWTETAILALPLKRCWQYWRRIALRHDPKKVLFNAKSDAVKSAWLASMNLGS